MGGGGCNCFKIYMLIAQQEFRRGYTTHDQISLLPTMQLFYLIVSHSGVWRTSDMKGSSSNELFSNARIYLVNLAGIYETFDTEL